MVIQRGHALADVGVRLCVSSHSLYKWVKELAPTKDEKQAAELIEAKGQVLRLRARMQRLEEERGLLKKDARYFDRHHLHLNIPALALRGNRGRPSRTPRCGLVD